MGIFLPGYPPYLLNWIQVRGIRRQQQKCYFVGNIYILWLLLGINKPQGLLVPRRVVHHKDIVPTFRYWFSYQEFPDGCNCSLVVKRFRLCNEEFPGFRDHKSAVWGLEPSRIRFYRWRTSFFEPSTGNRGLDLEVYFVLIDQDSGIVFLYFGAFFLNSFRSSVSSYPFDG